MARPACAEFDLPPATSARLRRGLAGARYFLLPPETAPRCAAAARLLWTGASTGQKFPPVQASLRVFVRIELHREWTLKPRRISVAAVPGRELPGDASRHWTYG